MENSLSIRSVLNKKEDYNLAIPFVESRQINPFYQVSVSLLYVDTTPNAAEIFKVGSRKVGQDNWEDLYSLTKPFLQRLATEAGIQFAPGAGDVVKVDANTWKASAFGALRLPDGSVRTSNNFKIIDLMTEEKRYRTAYAEKAERGIADDKAAKEAAKRYAGQWHGKTYIIADQDREKYITNSLLDAMAQLRSNAPQKAATGAILRVIRDLLGVKGTYTAKELRKPFAVARMSFSPDYNDPLVQQMMLQQAMQSVGNLFGNMQPVTQTISIPQTPDEDAGVEIPADPAEGPETDAAPPEPQDIHSPEEMPEDRTRDFCCDKCGALISEKVWDYSLEKFGRPLCYGCQKIVRDQEKRGAKR